MDDKVVLRIDNLRVQFAYDEGTVRAVDGVSFHLCEGETLGIVGESGCGKSVTALSILRLIRCPPGRIEADAMALATRDGGRVDIAGLDQDGPVIRSIRGREIAMIFQEPMTAFTPVYTIGQHLLEMLRAHFPAVEKTELRRRAVDMLRKVEIPNPEERFHSYPHELSGGLRQRAMIAMALSCSPRLLICDEPTTALDVTVQAQILELLKNLRRELNMSTVLITHNLGVVSEICDRMLVMYLGRIVERGTTHEILRDPLHPYTQGLMKSTPVLGARAKEKLVPIRGTVPSMFNLPAGCRFRDRCDHAMDVCTTEVPELTMPDGHRVSCWLYAEGVAGNARHSRSPKSP